METTAEIVSRARRRLVGAKSRQQLSWKEIFSTVDQDASSTLDFKELKAVVRDALHLPETTLSDHDLAILSAEIDKDGSGSLDLTEFLEFVARGPKRPEDEVKLLQLKTGRVQRNLRIGFQRFQATAKEASSIFSSMDREDDGKLSFYEFSSFVRRELKLTQWDVFESDLKTFYKSLDENGDGIDAQEFFSFLRRNNKNKGKGAFTFMDDSEIRHVRKKPLFKDQLLSALPKSHSSPSLSSLAPDSPSSRPGSSPSAKNMFSPSPSFVNLGRTRPPMVR
eukprot:TRINITY_DN57448_c0_g1_i1.p1 TRINITY_DN57448_c0_g1~~TRINITY_DN57448_c0_g1_i1.p1  ORF type:complete len:279 (-),score=53.58 TRINITY_DN57448_c0_g1_i1:20-856(-)